MLGRMVMDLTNAGARQFGIEEYPSINRLFSLHGDITFATDDPDNKELTTIWEFRIYGSSGISYEGLSQGC